MVKRKSGNDYTIEPGVAYVEGVRANMTALENINAANLPCSIYLDVVHHCTVTGAYETEIKFLKANKADYTDTTNRPHYVQILADIDRNGVVTDRRLLSPFLGINPLDLDDSTPNKADKRGHTHRLPLASLIKRGIVKLYSGYNSDAEDLAATPKAIKTLKAFIDALTRNLGNYIPNSKKSSRVDSNSADDVATSAAAKTAYDKGVEAKNAADNAQRSANDGINRANNAQNSANDGINRANNAQNSANDGINRANNAQRTANSANDNANNRVAKSGDTMTGALNIQFGDYSFINQFNYSGNYARIEVTPDDQANFYKLSYWSNDTELHSALLPKRGPWKVVAYEDWVNNGYVPRTGDTLINGRPTFEQQGGFITIKSTGVNWAAIDYKVWNSPVPLVTTQAEDLGNFSGAFNIYTTPEGTDYNTDRRQKTAQIHHNGRIWSKRYGWLDEQFAPANDTHKKSRCHNHWFPSHYAGAEVVDLPVNDSGGIRITWMGIKLPNYQPPYVDIYLPMAYSGFAKATVSDDGVATYIYGTEMIGNNIVRVYCKQAAAIGFSLQVIGWASF